MCLEIRLRLFRSRIIRIRVFGIRLLLVNPIRNSVSKGVTFRYSIVLGVNMTRQHFTDLLSHQRERHILAHTPQLTANEDSTDGVERSLEAPESHWYPTSAIVIRCSHTQQRRPKEKSNGGVVASYRSVCILYSVTVFR